MSSPSDRAFCRVMSEQQGPLYVNLDSVDKVTGARASLCLSWRQTSRNLTETEFMSMELQALVRRQILVRRAPEVIATPSDAEAGAQHSSTVAENGPDAKKKRAR